MKKILIVLFGLGIGLISCSEKKEDTSKLQEMAKNVQSTNDPFNVVSVYKSGDTLELFTRSNDGKFLIDKSAFNALNQQERAAMNFGFLMYLFPTSVDSNAVAKFFCGEDFPNAAWINYCDASLEEDVMFTKELLKANSRDNTIGSPMIVGESMIIIRQPSNLLLEIEKTLEGDTLKDHYNFQIGEKLKIKR